jgi:hypothetical protein
LLTPSSAPGTVNVNIHNPDGNQASLPNAFTFGIPPSIQVQPLSQSVVLNSNAQFRVQASGGGALSYQWQFNGANLLNLGGISGVQTPTLNISNLVSADSGSYQVVIANTYGTLVSTAATLTVLSPPSVTAPQSVAVGVGGTAAFLGHGRRNIALWLSMVSGCHRAGRGDRPGPQFSSVQTTNQGPIQSRGHQHRRLGDERAGDVDGAGLLRQRADGLNRSIRRERLFRSRCKRSIAGRRQRRATAQRCCGFTFRHHADDSVHHGRQRKLDGELHAAFWARWDWCNTRRLCRA